MEIVWTEYFLYRASVRNLDLAVIENILRYSSERYYDTEHASHLAVGLHHHDLVMVIYDKEKDIIEVVTAHATSKQQIALRIASGRYQYE